VAPLLLPGRRKRNVPAMSPESSTLLAEEKKNYNKGPIGKREGRLILAGEKGESRRHLFSQRKTEVQGTQWFTIWKNKNEERRRGPFPGTRN